MKSTYALALTALALSSVALIAQQPSSSDPQQSSPPPATQSAPPETQSTQTTAAPTASAPAVAMSSVQGELVDNLDTKTAKTGDSVVIKTKSTVKTADGTEIPKGSKLMGHVAGVKPSGGGNDNSQIALAFDRAELKGGQSVAIHSEIQSLSPAGNGSAGGGATEAMSPSPSGSAAGSASAPGSNPNGSASAGSASQVPSQPAPGAGAPAAAPTTEPAVGTVVARTGNIAIRTTAIPGVLLASNEPGARDPRLAQSSGILLGAKRDVHLDGGTQVVIGVAAGGSSGGGN